MTREAKIAIGVGVLGVALYLYLKPEARHAIESAAAQTQAALDRAAAQIRADAAAQQLAGQQKTARILGTIGSTAATVAGLWTSGVIGGGSAAAGVTAGGTALAASGTGAGSTAAAVGGGIGTAGTIAITGGIAGGAVLAFGIIKKGWFRGGWEGIRGNKLRDRFTEQFIYVYFPGAGIERQYDAMVRALAEVGIVGSGEPGSSTPNAGEMIRELYEADEESEMFAAFEHWRQVFHARGIEIAVPDTADVY